MKFLTVFVVILFLALCVLSTSPVQALAPTQTYTPMPTRTPQPYGGASEVVISGTLPQMNADIAARYGVSLLITVAISLAGGGELYWLWFLLCLRYGAEGANWAAMLVPIIGTLAKTLQWGIKRWRH